MSDEPKKRSWIRSWLWRVLFLIVIYPLSSGPAWWMVVQSGAGIPGVVVFFFVYRPVFVVSYSSEWSADLFERYVSLFSDITRYR